MTACALGTGPFPLIRHPGPIVSYSWQGYVLPPWLVEEARRTARDAVKPLERALLESVANDSTPNRWTGFDE